MKKIFSSLVLLSILLCLFTSHSQAEEKTPAGLQSKSIKEITSLGKENTRFYNNEDGTKTVVVQLKKQTARTENSLISSGAAYENKSNRFKVKFPKESKAEILTFSVQNTDISFELASSPTIAGQVYGLGQATGRTVSGQVYGVNATGQKNIDSIRIPEAKKQATADKMKMLDITTGVDLEYQVLDNGVKESIILKDSTAPGKFTFRLKANNLSWIERDSGRIDFSSKESGKKLFSLEPVFATDAAGGRLNSVTQSVYQSGAEILFEISIDKQSLAKARYPVTIDPTITLSPNESQGMDTYIESIHDPLINNGALGYIKIGQERGLLKFDLTSIPRGVIKSATLSLQRPNGGEYGYPIYPTSAYRITQEWLEDEATWTMAKTGVPWSQAGGAYSPASGVEGVFNTNEYDYGIRFDLTTMVNQWVNESVPNNGVILILDTNMESYSYYLYSSSGLYPPSLSITYAADVEAPVVSLTSPAAGVAVSGIVNVSANVQDPYGIQKAEFYVNNTLIGTSTTSPYQVCWNTAAFTNGTYKLWARAYDMNGNTGYSNYLQIADSFDDLTKIDSQTSAQINTNEGYAEFNAPFGWTNLLSRTFNLSGPVKNVCVEITPAAAASSFSFYVSQDSGITWQEISYGSATALNHPWNCLTFKAVCKNQFSGRMEEYHLKCEKASDYNITVQNPVGPPGALSGLAMQDGRNSLAWTPSATPGATYRIYRSAASGFALTPDKIIASGFGSTSYLDDTDLVAGATYYYRATAMDQEGLESVPSNEASVTCALTQSPAGLTASSLSAGSVNLSWTPSATLGATYKIYRSTTPGFTPAPSYLVASGVTCASFTDSAGLIMGVTYYYRVTAVDHSGACESPPSSQAPVTCAGAMPPAGLTAASPGPGSISLAWSLSITPGATYKIYRSTEGGFTPAPFCLLASSVAPVSFNDNTPQIGDTYYYRVTAVSPGGVYESLASNEASVTCSGTRPPAGLTAASPNAASVNLSWAPSGTAGATYKIYRSTTAGFTPAPANLLTSGVTAALFTDGSPEIGVTYYYRVIAAGPVYESLPSNEASVTCSGTRPPAGLTATSPVAVTINLAWTPSATPGATYKIYRSATSGFTPSPANLLAAGVTAASFTDGSPEIGDTYYYRVTAVGPGGVYESLPSNEASVICSGTRPPAGLAATSPVAVTINLAWTPSATPGATYKIYRSTEAGFAPSPANLAASGVTSASYTDSGGLTIAATYYYRVSAVGPGGVFESEPSNEASVICSGTWPPAELAATSPVAVTVNLAWTPSATPGATYKIYRSTEAGFTPSLANLAASGVTCASFTDSGSLTIAATYYYRVSAVGPGGIFESEPSNEASVTCSGTWPPAGLTAASLSAGSISLTWTPSATPGATYKIYRSATSGFAPSPAGLLASEVTATSFTDGSPVIGETYYYRVTATGPGGTFESEPSNEASVTCAGTRPPAGLTAASPGIGVVSLNWTPSGTPGATYKIYRGDSAGFVISPDRLIAESVSSSTYTDTSVASGTAYCYRVTAFAGVYESVPANEASVTTAGTNAPSGLTGNTVVDGGISLAWTPSTTPGATHNIYRGTTPGFAATPGNLLITGVSSATYLDTAGLAGGVTYYYRVSASDPAFSESTPTNEIAVTAAAPQAPAGLAAASPSIGSVNLTWTASATPGVTYKIYRGDSAGFNIAPGQLIAGGVNTTSYTDSAGIVAGTDYYYRVTALDHNGAMESTATNEAFVTSAGTHAPAALTGCSPGVGRISLAWVPSRTAGATYKIYRDIAAGFAIAPDKLIAGNVAASSYLDSTGLASGYDYYYRVTALSPDGVESLPTNEVAVTCAGPRAPTGLTAVSPGIGIVNLTWTPSGTPGVTYKIYRGGSAGFAVSPERLIAESVSSSTYTDTSVASGTAYCYRVTALSPDGLLEGDASNEASVTSAGTNAPARLTGNAEVAGGISLAWTPSTTPGVTYNIYRSTTPGFAVTPDKLIVKVNTAIHLDRAGLVDAATYNYRVTASDPAGSESTPTNEIAVTATAPRAPAGLAAASPSIGSVDLTWTASATPGVTYKIYRGGSAGFSVTSGSLIASGINAAGYTDSAGIIAGTDYYYRVTALDHNGAMESTPTNEASLTSAGTHAPSALSGTSPAMGQISLAWNPSRTAGVTYKIYRDTAPGFAIAPDKLIAGNVAVSNYLDGTGLASGYDYYYRVTALSPGDVESLPANEAYVICAGPRAPAGLTSVSPGIGIVNLFWTPSGTPGVTYKIYRGGSASFSATPGNLIASNINAAGYTDSAGIIAGTDYYYQVTALDHNGVLESPPTNEVCLTSFGTHAPAGLTASSPATGRISLTWTPSRTAGATYKVYRSVTAGFALTPDKLIASGVASPSYLDGTGLICGFDFYYRVTALSPGGIESLPANEASVTCAGPRPHNELPVINSEIQPPADLTAASVGGGGISLAWTPSATPWVTYNIYRSETAGFIPSSSGLLAGGVSDASFTDNNGLVTAHTYYYRVSAVTAAGSESRFSNEAQATNDTGAGGRLGVRPFWTYTGFDLPRGGGMVNMGSGNLVARYTDSLLPGDRLVSEVRRTYNSLDRKNGPFGFGWSANILQSLAQNPDGSVTYSHGDGFKAKFTYDPVTGYQAPPGIYLTLVKNPDKSYTVKRKDNISLFFDPAGRPVSIKDLNNNTITYTYTGNKLTGVTDTAGRTTSITYDATGRIAAVKDQRANPTIYGYDPAGNLASVTDPMGYLTRFSYDANHRLTQALGPANSRATLSYDTAGHVTGVSDGLNNTTTFTWDFNSGQSVLNDPAGHGTTFGFNPATGSVTYVTDALNGWASYTYDANYNLTSATDPGGHTTGYTYDSTGNILTKSDAAGTYTVTYNNLNLPAALTGPNGATTGYSYDFYGNLTATTGPLGHATTYQNDTRGRRTKATDPEGGTISYSYDNYGNLINLTDAAGKTSTFTYDSMGNVTTTTDPLGAATRYTYDSLGRLTRTDNPDGTWSTVTIDGDDKVLAQTNPNGGRTTYTYDPAGRVVSTTGPMGYTTTCAYDAAGNRTRLTDPEGITTTYTYDALNRLISSTDALGHTASYHYDSCGDMTEIVHPEGHAQFQAYNQLHQKISGGRRLTPGGADENVTTYTYDSAGNLLSTTDPVGNTTSYSYNLDNQLVNVTDAMGAVTAYGYDRCGRRVLVTNANGHTTSYSFDKAGRVLSEKTPNNKITAYAYDSAGRLISKTDAMGQTISCTYDTMGRLTQKACPDGSKTAYTYDGLGNRLSMSCAGQTTLYTYDADGNLIQISDGNGRKTGYTYDRGGKRKSITPYFGTQSYEYDGAGRLAAVTDFQGNRIALTLDADGKIANIDFPQGGTEAYTYNGLDQVTGINCATRDGKYYRAKYGYDANGNISSVAAELNCAGVAGISTGYTYDKLNRLCKVVSSAGSSTNDYTYDRAGNRLSYRQTGPGEGYAHLSERYYYDVADRLVKMDKSSNYAPREIHTYTYDANGNQTGESIDYSGLSNTVTNQYDCENRLTRSDALYFTGGKSWTTYTYDRDGRLAQSAEGRTVAGVTKGSSERYLYDGRQVIADVDGAGAVVASYSALPGGKQLSKYKWNGEPGKDRDTYYIFGDHLGSAVLVFGKSNGMIQCYLYDDFGSHTSMGDGEGTRFTFTGAPYFTGPGLYQMGARFYNPQVGRFITRDSYKGDIYRPWTQNLYTYCGNNPVNYVDPTGHVAVEDFDPETGACRYSDDAWKGILYSTQQYEIAESSNDPYSMEYWHNVADYYRGKGPHPDEIQSVPIQDDPTFMALSMLNGSGEARLAGEGVELATSKATVYISKNAKGIVQYVGITNNLARRAAEQLSSKGIPIDTLTEGLSRSDARAVEQALIEIHGLGKNGGTLMNKINSIAKSNPVYAKQLERGCELLKSIGYTE